MHIIPYLSFQTRDMTAMDCWMFICMIYVALAKFEYAVQLKIRFGKLFQFSKADADKNKNELEKRCQMIDHYALITFLGAYILTAGTYFYISYVYCASHLHK